VRRRCGYEQLAGDGLFGGDPRSILAGGRPDRHQRRTTLRHDRAHVGEVELIRPGRDQLTDFLDAWRSTFVRGRRLEGLAACRSCSRRSSG